MWRSVALRRSGLSGRRLLIVCAAAVLAGCAAYSTERGTPPGAAIAGSTSRGTAALPDQALLKTQPAPACDYKSGGTPQPDPAEAQRMKLDYERQCYRHAELLVRARLGRLQDAIKTARSQ